MYLKLKMRDLDCIPKADVEKEKKRLMECETLTVLNYIQTSIEVLVMMKD
jgi:hypothetical protein